MRNWFVLGICLSMMVTAQILWKLGLAKLGSIDVGPNLPGQIVKLLRSWQILAGLGIFGLTSLMWFDLLSKMELSLLYPFTSLCYVLAFFAGWLWLGEQAQWGRLVGISIIMLGIFLVSRTAA
jgi:drug/metabolite transporter (DMT)-like permease